MKFRTTMLQTGNNTGIPVPPEVIDALGGGKRPAVNVTVNGYSYRNTVASMGGPPIVVAVSPDCRRFERGGPVEESSDARGDPAPI